MIDYIVLDDRFDFSFRIVGIEGSEENISKLTLVENTNYIPSTETFKEPIKITTKKIPNSGNQMFIFNLVSFDNEQFGEHLSETKKQMYGKKSSSPTYDTFESFPGM